MIIITTNIIITSSNRGRLFDCKDINHLMRQKSPNEDFSVQNGYRVNVPNKNGLISLGLTADWTKQLEMIVSIGNSIRPTNQV